MDVSISEATSKLPELIEKVEQGESITLTREGKPIAAIVRVEKRARARPVYGVLKDSFIIHDPDWAKPQNDIEAWLAGDV